MKEEGEVEKDLEEVDVDLENDLQDFAQAANELECLGEGLLQRIYRTFSIHVTSRHDFL